jgi:hypothetical protein
VGIGSFSDPKDLPGLSHYLEHMLFMGSAAFPDENEYDAYLNKHGGCSNAYTELVRRVGGAVLPVALYRASVVHCVHRFVCNLTRRVTGWVLYSSVAC